MNDLIIFMFWAIFIAIGATVIAFYMDAVEHDDEWASLVATVEAGRDDW